MKHVGSRKQLFIDEAFFADSSKVKLTMNEPRKTGERTIVADKPWEVAVGGCDTVIEMGQEYWFYYDTHLSPSPDRPVMFGGEVWKETLRFMSLAVSTDGVHWRKPELGLVEFNGSRDTNILFPANIYCWGGPNHVFRDGRPGLPEGETLKAVVHWDGPRAEWPGATWILVSADGLHWSPLTDQPVYLYSDTDNTVLWDERIGRYAFYFRDNSEFYAPEVILREAVFANRREILTNKAGRAVAHVPGVRHRDYAFRKIRRFEVDDLRELPTLGRKFIYENSRVVAEADPDEVPGVDYDSNFLQKYPWAENVYLMFPGMLRHLYHPPFARQDPYPEMQPEHDAVCEVRLMTSRDGVRFNTPSRRPFVPLGVAGTYDSGFIESCTGMVRNGGELYLYYNCRRDTIRHGVVPHAYWRRDPPFISRLVMRLDGFVSVDADNEVGEFTTVPLVFTGRALVLNVQCFVNGYLIVELLREGRPIDQYTFVDCDAVEGNYIDRRITWNGNLDLSAVRGAPIQMRFVMRNAKLYAFQFADLADPLTESPRPTGEASHRAREFRA
jgi:hypothetical protein